MADVTFITGNADKARYMAELLGMPLKHRAVELDEVQSLDLLTVAGDKALRAYEVVGAPVLIDDTSLEFCALGRLPGPLIKWFLAELSPETLCSLLDGKDRSAVARCVFAYYDGHTLRTFEGQARGSIAPQPAGSNGFGWDSIYIPDGYTVTRAELNAEDDRKTYLQIKPIAALREFLAGR